MCVGEMEVVDYPVLNLSSSSAADFRYWYHLAKDPIWEDLHHPHHKPYLFTASIIPSVLGVGYMSPCKLFHLMSLQAGCESTITSNTETKTSNPAIEWGSNNEPLAVNQLVADYMPDWYPLECGLKLHPALPHIGATPDRILIHSDGDHSGSSTLSALEWLPLEVKCPWKRELPTTVEDIPLKWLMQVQIQLDCLSIQTGLLHIWRPFESKTFLISKCAAFCQDAYRGVDQFIKWLDGTEQPPSSRFLHKWISSLPIEQPDFSYLYRFVLTVY